MIEKWREAYQTAGDKTKGCKPTTCLIETFSDDRRIIFQSVSEPNGNDPEHMASTLIKPQSKTEIRASRHRNRTEIHNDQFYGGEYPHWLTHKIESSPMEPIHFCSSHSTLPQWNGTTSKSILRMFQSLRQQPSAETFRPIASGTQWICLLLATTISQLLTRTKERVRFCK